MLFVCNRIVVSMALERRGDHFRTTEWWTAPFALETVASVLLMTASLAALNYRVLKSYICLTSYNPLLMVRRTLITDCRCLFNDKLLPSRRRDNIWLNCMRLHNVPIKPSPTYLSFPRSKMGPWSSLFLFVNECNYRGFKSSAWQ